MNNKGENDWTRAFGTAVQERRLARKIQLKDAARAAGITENHLLKIEKGEVSTSITTAIKLCVFLEVSLDQALGIPPPSVP